MAEDAQIHHIRAAYAHMPPFVDVREENGEVTLGGFMPAILGVMANWMNFTVTFTKEPNDIYGSYRNGSWDGMVGMIYRGDADLTMNPLMANRDFLTFGFYTNPVTIEAFTMLSGKLVQDSGLFLYFSVLSPEVWAAVGFSLLVMATIGMAIYSFIPEAHPLSRIQSWGHYLWLFFAYMMNQGPTDKYIFRRSKALISLLLPLLATLWAFGVAFLVMNVFQSRLISKLTIVKSQPVVSTMADFAYKSGFETISGEGLEIQLVLNDTNLPVYLKCWKKIENNLLPMSGMFSDPMLNKVEKGKAALIHGHLIFENLLKQRFETKGTCNFHMMNNYFYPFTLTMGLSKRLPRSFRDKFNFGLTRLTEADIVGKWFKPNERGYQLCESYHENTLKPLNIKNLYGVIVLWCGGVTISAFTLACEILRHRYSKRRVPCKSRRTDHTFPESEY